MWVDVLFRLGAGHRDKRFNKTDSSLTSVIKDEFLFGCEIFWDRFGSAPADQVIRAGPKCERSRSAGIPIRISHSIRSHLIGEGDTGVPFARESVEETKNTKRTHRKTLIANYTKTTCAVVFHCSRSSAKAICRCFLPVDEAQFDMWFSFFLRSPAERPQISA